MRTAFVCAMVALFVGWTVGSAVASELDDSNATCLGCHTVGGQSASQVDFGTTSVNKSRCKSCHLLWHWDHPAYPCAQCHGSHFPPGSVALYGAPPFRDTAAGFFQSSASLNMNADTLHAIHVNTTRWQYDQDAIDGQQCGWCHSPSACSACHGSDVGHSSHASSDPGFTSVTYRQSVGYGIGPYNNAVTCVNANCHPKADPTGPAFIGACASCHATHSDCEYCHGAADHSDEPTATLYVGLGESARGENYWTMPAVAIYGRKTVSSTPTVFVESIDGGEHYGTVLDLVSCDIDNDDEDEVIASVDGGPSSPLYARSAYVAIGETTNGRPSRFVLTSTSVSSASYPAGIAAADLDGDGSVEIVQRRDHTLEVYSINPDRTVSSETSCQLTAVGEHDIGRLATGDVDQDGRIEIVVGTRASTGSTNSRLAVYELAGGSLVLEAALQVEPNADDIVVADLDEDCRPEIFVCYDGAYVKGYELLGGVLSTTFVQFGPDYGSYAIAAGDFVPEVPGEELVVGGGRSASPAAWNRALKIRVYKFKGGWGLVEEHDLRRPDARDPLGLKDLELADVTGDSVLDLCAVVEHSRGAPYINGSPKYSAAGLVTFTRSPSALDCYSTTSLDVAACTTVAKRRPYGAPGHRSGSMAAEGCQTCHGSHGESAAADDQACLSCHDDSSESTSAPTNIASLVTSAAVSFHSAVASATPRTYPTGSFVNGWGPGRAVHCSDCHSMSPTSPGGPHGTEYYGSNVAGYSEAQPSDSDTFLCTNCHSRDYYVRVEGDSNVLLTSGYHTSRNFHKLHGQSTSHCSTCHDVHGSESNRGTIRAGQGLVDNVTNMYCWGSCHYYSVRTWIIVPD